MIDSSFFKGKKIFVTGHTGFKGAWLCRILLNLGADLTGYALKPNTEPNLFSMCNAEGHMNSFIGDIRNKEDLLKAIKKSSPEIIIHMAAQPLVSESYTNPAYTYETNIMGTVNILEALRLNDCTKSFLNVTTDKVYKNNEWVWGYRENDELDGFDPYSNSKSCSELVTASYKRSFFSGGDVAISTARAGNVIGGGDFAKDRIIPDCFRSIEKGEILQIRSPKSIRPYQHVLDPLFAYLMIIQNQYNNIEYSGCYNIGPDDIDCVNTQKLVNIFKDKWGDGFSWEIKENKNFHEANFLKLDSTKLKSMFNWQPNWGIDEAVEKTVAWYKAYSNNEPIDKVMDLQINYFMETADK